MCENGEGQVAMGQKAFLEKLGGVLAKKFAAYRTGSGEWDIISDNLNPYIFGRPEYRKYFDNCGNHLDVKYPAYGMIVNHYASDGKMMCQEHFKFLKTEGGYKLIYTSMI